MAEPPRLAIRRDFPRPAEADIAPFRTAPTGWVVDAQGRRGALHHSIRPLTKTTRFVGTALTVRTRPLDNLAPYAALRFARPGDVLVVATDMADHGSIMGDIILGMAKNAGVVAAVTDGFVRDIAGIDQVGIPVFSRGLSPNSPMKDGPGAVGVPVSIAGMMIFPGDLLIGDIDGIVVVPRKQVGAVGTALTEVAQKEAKMEASVAAGAPWPAWLDEVLASRDVHYLDEA
jgi:4-hydroxy-4-methyl-2-oxoglutarate aldolase